MATQVRTNKFTVKTLEAIFNKRKMASSALVGRKIVVTIQGDGNVVDAQDASGNPVPSVNGGILQKRVFNTRANSEVAVRNQRNRDILAQIKIANKSGDENKVDELVNEYLNKVQLSFNVLSGSAFFEEGVLQNGAEISATLQEITTPKGSFMTLDPSSISVLKPATLGESKFSFDMDLEDDGAPAGPAEPTVNLQEPITMKGKTFTRAQWNTSGWNDAAIAAQLELEAAPAPPKA